MIAVITDVVTAWYFFNWKLLLSQVNRIIYFSALKKSEQAETIAFNRLFLNYNIHFSFYRRGDQTTRVDSCDACQKNME